MRDPALMLTLLHEMADERNGRIAPYVRRNKTGSTPEEDSIVRHHLELLIDANHAERVSRAEVRITNDGYDFLNAIKQDKKYEKNFFEYFHAGATYVEAAIKVVDTASKAATILAG